MVIKLIFSVFLFSLNVLGYISYSLYIYNGIWPNQNSPERVYVSHLHSGNFLCSQILTKYAKVTVRNIREGFLGANLFRKTGIVLIFIGAIIGGDIPANSCVVHSFIHFICVVTASFFCVGFYSLRHRYCQCGYKNLKCGHSGATVTA